MCLIPISKDFEDYDVQKNGKIVTATITYIPVCLGTKTSQYMEFKYAEMKFDKNVGCNFSDTYKVGDTIKFKHLEGTDIFLFEEESIESEFIASGLLAIVGITFIVIGARRK